jgi:hypothetical protein
MELEKLDHIRQSKAHRKASELGQHDASLCNTAWAQLEMAYL